jgi:hypothetical protein
MLILKNGYAGDIMKAVYYKFVVLRKQRVGLEWNAGAFFFFKKCDRKYLYNDS